MRIDMRIAPGIVVISPANVAERSAGSPRGKALHERGGVRGGPQSRPRGAHRPKQDQAAAEREQEKDRPVNGEVHGIPLTPVGVTCFARGHMFRPVPEQALRLGWLSSPARYRRANHELAQPVT